jgi:hypothetical protein
MDPNFLYQKQMLLITPITVKLGDKEHFDKEQIGVKTAFPMTNCQFTS